MTEDELAELKRLAHSYGTTELDQHASFDLPDDLRLSIVRASAEDAGSAYVRAEMERLRAERDEARMVARRAFQGRMLPAGDYDWIDNEDAPARVPSDP